MVAAKTPRRQAATLRWKSPPWDQNHPDFLRIDKVLPPDDIARFIDRAVDQLDLQPYLRLFCAGFGSDAWHPALLLKLVLFEMNYRVHSPQEWLRHTKDSDSLKWLLRGARPSRAVLYECRRRLTPRLLKRLNRAVLLTARAEGLAPALRGSLDGTFTAARSSRHRLITLAGLDKRLAILELAIAADEAIATDLGGGVLTHSPRWLARSPQGRKQQRARYQRAHQRLAAKMQRHQQRQSSRAKARRKPVEEVTISPREPEAVLGKDKSKVIRPLYDVQILRDLDSPFYLGYGVFATNSDAGLLPRMLIRTKGLCGTLPKGLLADSIYASVHDLRVCQRRQIHLYAAVEKPAARRDVPAVQQEAAAKQADQAAPAAATKQPAAGQGARRQALAVLKPEEPKKKKLYGKEQFVWQEETRSYQCPAGQRLELIRRGVASRVHGGERAVEWYATRACADCAVRGECTRSKRGRQIKRMVDEPLVEELRQRMASTAGKQLYRLRKQTIELAFAHLLEHRGLRRFWGFGLDLAETQVALLVLLHNLKTLFKLRQAASKVAT